MQKCGLGRPRWGADALVREPLPSRQRCSPNARSADETSAPHLGAVEAAVFCKCKCADWEGPRWSADALVREPLPSRQRCPADTRSADETSAPHFSAVEAAVLCKYKSADEASAPHLGTVEAAVLCKYKSADETSAPHLGAVEAPALCKYKMCGLGRAEVGRGRPRPRAAAVEAAVFCKCKSADETSAPHLGAVEAAVPCECKSADSEGTKWGADALVREPLPSRQRFSGNARVRTRRPHPTWEPSRQRFCANTKVRTGRERSGARTPSSASRCRRGSGSLGMQEVRTRRPHPTWEPSRQRCSGNQ